MDFLIMLAAILCIAEPIYCSKECPYATKFDKSMDRMETLLGKSLELNDQRQQEREDFEKKIWELKQLQQRNQAKTNRKLEEIEENIKLANARKAWNNLPQSCETVDPNTAETSGVYLIHHKEIQRVMRLTCDVETDGGGWTVFQRRIDGKVEFHRNWYEYVRGFGYPDGEFWLGLENIHLMTVNGDYELRIDLMDWDKNEAYAEYGTFFVGNLSDNYRLTLANYRGNAGDSMISYHNNQPFSTKDRENDNSTSENCAVEYMSGWWFSYCYRANLNGKYSNTAKVPEWKGIIYDTWKGNNYSLKSIEMKFRKKIKKDV